MHDVGMFVCHYMCEYMCVCVPQHKYGCQKTNSAVSPCLSPCLRQGLRDALSVTAVDPQASGKAGLLSVFAAVG